MFIDPSLHFVTRQRGTMISHGASTTLTERLPLLRATTSDTVNLPEVLAHLIPDNKVLPYTKMMVGGNLFYSTVKVEANDSLYTSLVENGKTLLLINQEDESGLAVNVGEVPVPQELLESLIEGVTENAKQAYKLLPAFRGLTLKAASEVIRMVITANPDYGLTIPAVLRERSRMVGRLKGLSLVDTATLCYLPDAQLSAWVKTERPYFEGATDPRLIPRGLLFDGVPGTGKTQGAKYIARELGVPLYRLDLASSMSKWVGDSEANFSRVLSALDQEEPAVFVIDRDGRSHGGPQNTGTTRGTTLAWVDAKNLKLGDDLVK